MLASIPWLQSALNFFLYTLYFHCICMCACLCAVFLTAYYNISLSINTNVETAKAAKYDPVMISERARKQDGLIASCKIIATRTIVIDTKFIHWCISQIPELLYSNYVVTDALIVRFITTVLKAFFFRMHATYRIHHTDRDFGKLIISGKEKLWTSSFRKWRKDGFYEIFQ
jgi:hypothetical protein